MSGRWAPGLALWLALGLLGQGAAAADLAGRLELLKQGGKQPAAGEDVRQAVIWFTPSRPATPRRAGTFDVVTEGKRFVPRLLTVPVGSTVRFPNRDPILHNAFSVSEGNTFDLGLLGSGASGSVRLDQPGVVRVFCNVHHPMVAYLVVLATPFYTSPDASGAFMLPALPSGPGRLTVWYERSAPLEIDLELPRSEPLAVSLEISKPRVPPHMNKLGRRYGRSRGRY